MERRVALVTGASGDIGSAIARALAADGFAVCAHYRSREERARALVREIEEAGGAAAAVAADLTDPAGAQAAVDAATGRWGRLDALVNAAGGNKDVLTLWMTDADFDGVVASNLRAAFLVSRAALRPMIERKYGRVVNVASVSAWVGVPGQANYAAAKAGLIGLTKALAAEVARFGILVNAVAPGAIESEAVRALPEERRRRMLAGIPLGRWGKPADVGRAVAFLASERTEYVTGQVLAVSGGLG
ncbi:MAG: 3-oxoacyl-ACP reductase FabG [Planctomycetes bacterium]|jgi:3-oxoacyl-[acyl-carrier protein] reductase|nr:3-oxoacyl-ACP reductase FabG [Planctomycetota bacterium]